MEQVRLPETADILSVAFATDVGIGTVYVQVRVACLERQVVVIEIRVRIAVTFRSQEDARMEVGHPQTGIPLFVLFHL